MISKLTTGSAVRLVYIVALSTLATFARGQSETFTDPLTGGVPPYVGISPTLTNWGHTGDANPIEYLEFPQFNLAGTLNSVTLSVGADVITTFTISSTTPPASYTATSMGSVSTYAAQTSAPTSGVSGAPILTVTTVPNSVSGTLTDSNPLTIPGLLSQGASSTTIGPASVYIGGGNIFIPVAANGMSSATSGNGNFSNMVSTDAEAYGAISYNYTPTSTATPEPGSMALLTGSVLSGSLFARRRKRRA